MAKDRFKTRRSYDNNFKQSGQLGSQNYKPKKQKLSEKHLNALLVIQGNFKDKMNDWEAGFMKSIIKVGFRLTIKQQEILKKIKEKYQGRD